MSESDWISAIWLTAVLAAVLTGFRGHQLGWRKGVVMALVWLAIFLVASGIAAYLDRQQNAEVAAPPSQSASSRLT